LNPPSVVAIRGPTKLLLTGRLHLARSWTAWSWVTGRFRVQRSVAWTKHEWRVPAATPDIRWPILTGFTQTEGDGRGQLVSGSSLELLCPHALGGEGPLRGGPSSDAGARAARVTLTAHIAWRDRIGKGYLAAKDRHRIWFGGRPPQPV